VFSGPSGDFVLDLNPRFGGGYPFAHMAGANVPAALVAWAEGREARPEWLSVMPGVVSAKCDRLVELGNGAAGKVG
jgi:carbamoyl-phosphate synthase large subunit